MIYLIVSEEGDYSDYIAWVTAAFDKKGLAEEWVAKNPDKKKYPRTSHRIIEVPTNRIGHWW